MNALGILSGAAAGTAGNAASNALGATSAQGQTSGFAGMLVQVIGGATGNETSTSGNGIGFGLNGYSGLTGLLGVAAETDQASTDLMTLLTGLLQQLEQLGQDQELPLELQQQLASLLTLLQNLLPENGMSLPLEGNVHRQEQSTMDARASAFLAQQQGQAAQQSIVGQLQTTLQQLSARLSLGEPLTAQASALVVPLRQAMQSLQMFTAVKSSDSTAAPLFEGTKQSTETGHSAANRTVPQTQAQLATTEVDASVRKTAIPLRNPVWSFQTTAAATDNGQAATSVSSGGLVEATGSAGTAESSSPGNPAPVWSLLKSDSVTTLGNPANATVKVPVQQFAEQMGKYLVKQFVMSQGNGVTEAKISLHPEHLGQLDIKIMIQNGTLTAKFIAENVVARDLLENQLGQLRATLLGQGLQVEKMEVVQQTTTTAASFFQNHQQHRGSKEQSENGQHRGSGNLYQEAAEFEAELERTAYLREIGYGNAINVTA